MVSSIKDKDQVDFDVDGEGDGNVNVNVDGNEEVDVMNDELLYELPVFLNHTTSDCFLYLISAPFRPNQRPYTKLNNNNNDNSNIDSSLLGDNNGGLSLNSVKIKPIQKRVEFEYLLDQQNQYNDQHSARNNINNHSINPYYDEYTDYPIEAIKMQAKQGSRIYITYSINTILLINYAIGVIRDGIVHLSPLHSFCKVKPFLGHVDEKAERETKEKEEEKKEIEKREREEEEDNEEWTPAGGGGLEEKENKDDRIESNGEVLVDPLTSSSPLLRAPMFRFRKAETEKSFSYRRHSHAYITQMEQAEKWKILNFKHPQSSRARELFNQQLLYSNSKHNDNNMIDTESRVLRTHSIEEENTNRINFNIKAEEYLSFTKNAASCGISGGSGNVAVITNIASNLLFNSSLSNPSSSSLSSLSSLIRPSLPLPDRILSLLRSARLLPFHLIVRQLQKSSLHASDILPMSSYLLECFHICDRFAHFVQSTFVIKSAFLSDLQSQNPTLQQNVKQERISSSANNSYSSSYSSRLPSRDELCRDYLITCFYHSRYLIRESATPMMRLDYESAQERLKELAIKKKRINSIQTNISAVDNDINSYINSSSTIDSFVWEWKYLISPQEDRAISSLVGYHEMIKEQSKLIKEMETRVKWALQEQNGQSNQQQTHLKSLSSSSSSLQTLPYHPSVQSLTSQSSAVSNLQAGYNEASHLILNILRKFGVASEKFLLEKFQHAQNFNKKEKLQNLSLQEQNKIGTYKSSSVYNNKQSKNYIKSQTNTESPSPSSPSILTPSSYSSSLDLLNVADFLTIVRRLTLSIPPSLYIRKSLNNPHIDRYRSVIASQFAVSNKLKKREVYRSIFDHIGDELPDNLYRKVMKEFAVFNKGEWVLKSGSYADNESLMEEGNEA